MEIKPLDTVDVDILVAQLKLIRNAAKEAADEMTRLYWALRDAATPHERDEIRHKINVIRKAKRQCTKER